MGKDAINDPTATEIVAKAIIEKRQQDHINMNLQRKQEAESMETKMSRKHLKSR
jgi:hypothetical protein